MSLAFDPLTIPAGAEHTFFLGISAALYPHDGDSCDIFILPATDITTGDGTIVAGPDSCNSLGYNVIDGLIADQLVIHPGVVDTITPGETIYNVLSFDIPRNGYLPDTLQIISIANQGSASEHDVDSMILFKDNGDNIWGGIGSETYICRLTFIGDRWIRSGLSIHMSEPTTRFYIGAAPAAYPANNASLILSIPQNGLEMISDNDGPIDNPSAAGDTVTIKTLESIAIKTVPIPASELVPGADTNPIFGCEMTNGYAEQIAIDSLACRLFATDTDGATQAQLDSQIDSLALYLNLDGVAAFVSEFDSLLAKAVVLDGAARFIFDNFVIEPWGGTAELVVTAWLNLENSKNNNRINLGIESDAAIFTSIPLNITGSFPAKNPEDFIIDIFPASAMTVNALPGGNFFGEQSNQPVLDFTLPDNGYAPDFLIGLQLLESGSFKESMELLTLKLWADPADDGFTEDDILLGKFDPSGDIWKITGLSYPLAGNATRFIVTIDVAGDEFQGGTFRLTVPLEGVVYGSGVTGPDDLPASNPDDHLIFPSDQIIAFAIPEATSTLYPASRKNKLLTLALYNGYVGQNRSIRSLTLDNATRTASSADFADTEIGQISLYYDSDFNGTFSDDSLLTSGHFTDGLIQLTGFDIVLPAESLSYFFIVADVPAVMVDSDSLAVEIAQTLDILFDGPVKISGNFPLRSGGYAVVDGSVAGQYQILPVPTPTLSPGDTAVTFLAFRPALNGDREDILETLTIDNVEDADTSDIVTMKLWMDLDSDDILQPTDAFIGEFNYINDTWIIDNIDLTVGNTPPTLFVAGNISATAMPGAQFRGAIPVDGCQYTSDNDGPVDVSLTGNGIFKISNSGLRITCNPLDETYSIGQAVDVGITVTNLLTVSMDNVIGRVVAMSDSSIVSYTGGSFGPVTLSPGESTEFDFGYIADAIGELFWQLTAPDNAIVQLINSVPASVIRGQTNVFPLSVKFPHPNRVPSAASLRLENMRLRVENGDGTPLLADQVFSRMVLSSGYTNLTILETLPAQAEIDLIFSEPMIVISGEEQLLSVLVDIESDATADDFVLSINDVTAVPLLDNNTAQPVAYDTSVAFPLKTVSCRIDDPSQQMVVSDSSLLNNSVNYGQDEVDVMMLRLRHPGNPGSSQIQLTAVSLGFVDDLGTPLVASGLFDKIRLVRRQTVIAELENNEINSSVVEMELASPLTLSPGDLDSLNIEVDVKNLTVHSGFSMLITDSTGFIVRDLSSGLPLATGSDTTYTLATESVFPINSGWTDLQQPAGSAQICISAALPPSIVGGRDSLGLIDLSLTYPVGSEYAAVQLNEIYMAVLDTTGIILDPRELFDEVGYCADGGPYQYQDFIQLVNGAVRFEFGGGIVLHPGDSINLQLICDIENAIPYDHFVLILQTEDALVFADRNDPGHNPGFEADEGCAITFPYSTGVTSVFMPAGQPIITIIKPPTQLASAGHTGVNIWQATLNYDSEIAQGDLNLNAVIGWVYKRTATGAELITGESVFDGVHLIIDNEIIAEDSTLAGDSILFEMTEPYIISRGMDLHVDINCDIGPDAENGNYFIRFQDSSFMSLSDRNLATSKTPVISNDSYPLATAEISLAAADLEQSFTNYPNPFNPADRETIIGFTLNEDAYIDIEIYAITGRAVREIAINSFRTADSYNEDTWGGDNDGGLDVVPGTYFCRITARYVSGRSESIKRKIAVIR